MEDIKCPNMLHLYTGDGKGKTSAAMGLALRSAGHKHIVIVAQFLKTGKSGELAALRKFSNVTIMQPAPLRKFTRNMSEAELTLVRVNQTEGVHTLTDAVNGIKPQLTVLDELALAISMGLVPEREGLALISTALQYGDVVVTGREAPQSLLDRADYSAEIRNIKHPYDRGVKARQGIEF